MSKNHNYTPVRQQPTQSHVYFANNGYAEGKQMHDSVTANIGKEGDTWARQQNGLMEHTATVFLPLVTYLRMKMEDMIDGLDGNTPFSLKLRNKGNHVLSEAEDFIKCFEDLIPTAKGREAYMNMFDGLYPLLDGWFQNLAYDPADEPKREVIRRSKMRYRDPYKISVKECNAAFEDGYIKGWYDSLDKLIQKLEDKNDGEVQVNIDKNRNVEIVDLTK